MMPYENVALWQAEHSRLADEFQESVVAQARIAAAICAAARRMARVVSPGWRPAGAARAHAGSWPAELRR